MAIKRKSAWQRKLDAATERAYQEQMDVERGQVVDDRKDTGGRTVGVGKVWKPPTAVPVTPITSVDKKHRSNPFEGGAGEFMKLMERDW